MKLGSVCDVVRGSSPRPQGDPKYYGGEVPRLMIADLTRDGMIVYPKIDSLTLEGAKKSRPMKKGDLIIAVSGDPGRPCILGVDACIHDGFVGLRNLNENKVWKPFLYYFFLSIKRANKKNAVGAIFQNFTTDQIKNIDLPDISIEDQIRISTILNQCEEIIAKRIKSIQILDRLLKSTFLSLFGDPTRNEKNWVKEKLINLCTKIGSGSTPRGGKTSYVVEGISLIRSLNVHNNEFRNKNLALINDKQAHDLRNVIVEIDDVLLNITGASVARCCLVPKTVLPARVNQHVAILRTIQNILNPQFLVRLITNDSFQRQLIKRSKMKGATREAITKEELEELQIIVPPINLQVKFVTIAEEIENIRKNYTASLNELRNLNGSLSQKAFRGGLNLSKLSVLYEEEYEASDNDRTEPKRIDWNKIVVKKKDITKMSLDEHYEIPKEIQEKYGSIEAHVFDWEFFFKKHFANKIIETEPVKEIFSTYNYQRGSDFDYEEYCEIIFKELEKTDSYLKQRYNETTKKNGTTFK